VRGMARDGGQPMSMSKCSIGLLLVTLLCAAGCTHLPWRRTPPDYEGPPPTQAYAGKLPVDQASEASSAAMTDTDRQAMLEVIDQLQSISGLTQDERQQLMADLRRTKPSLWPAMVQQFRAALAFRQQLQEREASQAAETQKFQATRLAGLSQPLSEPTAGAMQLSAVGGEPRQVSSPQGGPLPVATALTPSRPAAKGVVSVAARDRLPNRPPGPPQSTTSSPVAPAANPSDPSLPLLPGQKGTDPAPRTEAFESIEEPLGRPSVDRIGGVRDPRRAPAPRTEALVRPADSHRPLDPLRTPPLTPQRAAAAMAADLAAPSEVDWHDQLTEVIRDLEQRTTTSPRTSTEINQHSALRILYLVAGRREDALRPIPGISPVTQDFWSKQLYGLSTYLDSSEQPDSARRATVAKQYLCEAASKLGDLGLLTVQNLALCTEVSSFGVFRAFKRQEFTPGQEALLYAEVNNFWSEETEKGFRTALRSSYQVLDGDGKRVAHREFAVTEDYCKSRRRDFFMRYFIRLPAEIAPGSYTLELTIEDTLANKIGQSSLPLVIKTAASKRGG
jgi:hypothetical protein